MLAPLQLRSFHLIEFYLSANPSFDPSEEGQPLGMVITVRDGQPLIVRDQDTEEVEATDDPPIGFSLDVGTDLFPGEPEDEEHTPLRVILNLAVNMRDDVFARAPYQCSAAAFGDFTAVRVPKDEAERAQVLRVIRANAAGILYGSVRTLLLQATQFSPYSSLLLPSLSFREIVQREVELEGEERGTANPSASDA
jgi:preprotein translocase subunit SecB